MLYSRDVCQLNCVCAYAANVNVLLLKFFLSFRSLHTHHLYRPACRARAPWWYEPGESMLLLMCMYARKHTHPTSIPKDFIMHVLSDVFEQTTTASFNKRKGYARALLTVHPHTFP